MEVNSLKKKICIEVTTFNEEENVELMYETLTAIMQRESGYDYALYFVDNHSEDTTEEKLRAMAARDKHVKVILNLRNFGPNRSGANGFYAMDGDAYICLPCDFQGPPELIPTFLREWEKGAKVVWGKKTASGESKLMWHVRSLYYKIIRYFSDVKMYEQITGFGLYDREVVKRMEEAGDPIPYFRNLIPELGYEPAMVEFVQPARERGKSSYNLYRYFNEAMASLVNTSQVPLKIATVIGFVLGLLSFCLGLAYLVLKLAFWDYFPTGTAPILIGMFFLGSVQIFFIGIVGEYVGEILTRVTHHPRVVEKERLNFDDEVTAQ